MDKPVKSARDAAGRNRLAILAVAFLAGSLLGEAGGCPAVPALACLALSFASPDALGLAAGGFAAGVLAAQLPPPARPAGSASCEGAFAGKVLTAGRGSFDEEQALVRVYRRDDGETVRLTACLAGSAPFPRAGEDILFRVRLHAPLREGEPWRGRLEEGGWIIAPPGSGPAGWVRSGFARIRNRVREAAAGMGEEGGVLAALAIGECDMLSPRVLRDFRAAGTYHLLAVSGVHVAAVLAIALMLVRPFALPLARLPRPYLHPALAAFAAAAALAFYLGVVRGSASALRAAIFGALLNLGWLVRRERTLGAAAAASLLGLTVFTPAPVPDLSLALSLAGCLGIAASWRREDGWGRRLVRISLGACLFTLPIAAPAVRNLPLFSPLFNLLFGPVCDAVLIPLAVTGDALAGWWSAGATAVFAVWRALAIPLLAAQRALLPEWACLPLTLAGALAASATAAVGSFLWWRRRGDLRLAVFLLLAPLAGELGNQLYEAARPGTRAVFAAAGQSDLCLLRTEGWTVLIDSGPPPATVVPRVDRFLAEEGVDRVDVLALTHPHPDHAGGAAYLLQQGRVAELVLPAGGGEMPWRKLLDCIPPSTRVRFVRRGEEIILGGSSRLRVLGAGDGEEPASNRSSLVLLYAGDAGCALFPGDASWSQTLAAWIEAGPLLLLKVPHHGSAAGGFPRSIPRGLSTRLAVFCAAAGASRSLPAPAVKEAFFRALIPTATTGAGAVRVGLGPGRPGFSVDNPRHIW
jgi:competence protein ComEC